VLQLEISDQGKGMTARRGGQGIGLVGMRERAEIVGGRLELVQPDGGGTLVRLTVPREKVEVHGG
jgi:signal transduction histidine kinase